MLKNSHISDIAIYSTEWDAARLGRFTSSNWHRCMADKLFSEAFMTYVYQKAGEELTGKTTAEEDVIEDENTQWGKDFEPDAIRKFGISKGLDFLVTQKMIFDPESRFSSTPDAIWVHGRSVLVDGEQNVSTLEVKCPRKYHKFIPLYQCKTPDALKSFNKSYYWQVMDQMYNCDSAVGYFACYHPLFPEGGNFNVIEFRKMDLWDDFKKMKERKAAVLEKFEEIRNSFLGI